MSNRHFIWICLLPVAICLPVTLHALPALIQQACDDIVLSGAKASGPEDVESRWREVITAKTPPSQVLSVIETISQVEGSETIALRTKLKSSDDNESEAFHRVRKYAASGKEVGVVILLGGLSRSLEVMHKDFRNLISNYQKKGISVLAFEALGQGISQVVRYLREDPINHEDPIDFEKVQAPSTVLAIQQALVRFGYLESKKHLPELPVHLSGESYSGHLTARVAKDMPGIFSSWTPIVGGALSTGQVMLTSWLANFSASWVATQIQRAEGNKIRQQQYYRDDLFKKTSEMMAQLLPELSTDQIVRNGVIRLINGMLLSNAFEDVAELPVEMQKTQIIAENDQVLPPIIHYWLHAAALRQSSKTSRLVIVQEAQHHMLSNAQSSLTQFLVRLSLAPQTLPETESGVYEFDLKTGEIKPISWAKFKTWALKRSNQWLEENRQSVPRSAGFVRADFSEQDLTQAPSWTGIKGLSAPTLQ